MLFLGYDPTDMVFYLFNGPFGMYRVRDGQMHAVHSETGRRRGDTPATVDAFLADVATKVAGIR